LAQAQERVENDHAALLQAVGFDRAGDFFAAGFEDLFVYGLLRRVSSQ
jgi:hypothetical protein